MGEEAIQSCATLLSQSTCACKAMIEENEEQVRDETTLLELPILVLETIVWLITDPYDLKALRSTCKEIRSIINKNPDILLRLKVIPKDLKTLECIIDSEEETKWNNFRFPPELYYIGCRRHYIESFNNLFTSFTNTNAKHIQILDMDRFDLSNAHQVNFLKSCQKLVSFKVDAFMVKGVSEDRLKKLLEDEQFISVFRKLKHFDVTALEFLIHDYQFEFMGKLLHKCEDLQSVSSWGFFPEWEQPVGSSTHLKHFLWPLLTFLRSRFPQVDFMLREVEAPQDLSNLNFHFLSDAMDWQSGKWILDLRPESESDFTNLEMFLYSKIKSYSHRAVGWFDEAEFRKSALHLMTNLSTIHIHNARDIKMAEPSPFVKPLFPKLNHLTLIVGNRLTADDNEQDLPLEKVVVDMLLNSSRPSVTSLALDVDLDHHHRYGSIDLPSVIINFPNLSSLCIEELGPSNEQMFEIYNAFPNLQVLMFCGRNMSDSGFVGKATGSKHPGREIGIDSLKYLRILKIFSVRLPPKNVFPWPSRENNCITDLSFTHAFRKLKLRKFHFLIKSEKITKSGLKSLLTESFGKSFLEFAMNWFPVTLGTANHFESIHPNFKFLDPQNEPANFVIPDIGKWVL